MAAEWDNLIPDGREMAISGSFNDNKDRGRTKNSKSTKQMSLLNKKDELSSASSEQSLLSDDQEKFEVTEYIMEYTDIFEPSTQKIDFIDIEEGDAISEVTNEEIVAHSSERRAYEHTQEDTPTEERDENISEDDEKVGPLGTHKDSKLDNEVTDEHDEQEEGYENAQENTQVNTEIEAHQQSQVENKTNGLNNDEMEDRIEISKSTEEEKEGLNDRTEMQSENEEGDLVDEEVEEKAVIDEEEEKTEVDKLLESDNDEQTRISKKDKQRNKNERRQKSAGTQVAEEEPLLNTPPSPEPQTPASHPPQPKKTFSPKAYPGKVVKSVAIGTDDQEITNTSSTSRRRDLSRHTEVDVDRRRDRKNKEKAQNTRTNEKRNANMTHASKHRLRGGWEDHGFSVAKHRVSERTSHSSDANFFRSRLPQTSKRHPKRHVWLVRDSEIHRLVAEKAAILRRYKDEGVTGHSRSKGFPNYSEVDVLGLPSVGFPGKVKNDQRGKAFPYDKHPSSQSRHLYGEYSSEDEDELTNRVGTKGSKPSGTFAVGLSARRDNHVNKQHAIKQQSEENDDDGCQLCAAEAKEKEKQENKLKELEATAKAGPHHPRNLMLGIVYSAKFLGSTNLMSPSAPNKAIRLQQAQEAIGRIKVPDGEEQPSSDVDLFISTERIKVVSSEQKKTLIDHSLKTISFIADIGQIIVVMARLSNDNVPLTWSGKMPEFNPQNQEEKTAKVVCHVLEIAEAQTVAKTVGQAFSIAYHEFLKTNELNINEIEESEYNGILEQQKILAEDLALLADETKAKEVVIHKKYGESLSMMVVESGWGSMVPTVVIAHLENKGPAAKSGQLNVGNQILAVNGQSLVGLPLLECQTFIRSMKYEERVALKVVFCPPTVEICVNRPDTKYQLGFSVQNGMICSLMRGGIAERGGVRVGHKIIEMNGESVVAASHHHIVEILQTTIGELRMKTMPITLYKLLVGLEIPHYL